MRLLELARDTVELLERAQVEDGEDGAVALEDVQAVSGAYMSLLDVMMGVVLVYRVCAMCMTYFHLGGC